MFEIRSLSYQKIILSFPLSCLRGNLMSKSCYFSFWTSMPHVGIISSCVTLGKIVSICFWLFLWTIVGSEELVSLHTTSGIIKFKLCFFSFRSFTSDLGWLNFWVSFWWAWVLYLWTFFGVCKFFVTFKTTCLMVSFESISCWVFIVEFSFKHLSLFPDPLWLPPTLFSFHT